VATNTTKFSYFSHNRELTYFYREKKCSIVLEEEW